MQWESGLKTKSRRQTDDHSQEDRQTVTVKKTDIGSQLEMALGYLSIEIVKRESGRGQKSLEAGG